MDSCPSAIGCHQQYSVSPAAIPSFDEERHESDQTNAGIEDFLEQVVVTIAKALERWLDRRRFVVDAERFQILERPRVVSQEFPNY